MLGDSEAAEGGDQRVARWEERKPSGAPQHNTPTLLHFRHLFDSSTQGNLKSFHTAELKVCRVTNLVPVLPSVPHSQHLGGSEAQQSMNTEASVDSASLPSTSLLLK